MANDRSIEEVADEILESILASPKRQRRLYSKTFWGRFGYRTRTRERVERVADALRQRNVVVTVDAEFGTEGREDWLLLTYVPADPLPGTVPAGTGGSAPTPADDWFAAMAARSFESEREVEYFFVMPLLEQLDYSEADFAVGLPVTMFEGVTKVRKQADFVVFDGPNRDNAAGNALIVVEAKMIGRPITPDVLGQAKAYAIWLSTPYYLATNGDEIVVVAFRGALLPDVPVLSLRRTELRDHWPALYQTLNRAAVLDYKRQLAERWPQAASSE